MSFFGVQLNAKLNTLMFQIRLNLAKNRYAPNIRTLYRKFTQFDPQITGLVLGYNFQKALNCNGIFMKKYDLQVFQKAYNQNGRINWFNFLNQLKEPMSPFRREFVSKLFESIDASKSGRISTQDLMSHFNFNQIETYRNGKKNQEQIFKQLLQMLYVVDGYVSKQEFISFYDDLNINFVHNEVFIRCVSSQWYYTPEKMQQVKDEQVKKIVLALRNKLLEKTQASKDQLSIIKLYEQYDRNKNSCLGAHQLDYMLKNLGLNAQPRLVEPVLSKIDKNKSGYIEFDEFKKFLYHHPYQL